MHSTHAAHNSCEQNENLRASDPLLYDIDADRREGLRKVNHFLLPERPGIVSDSLLKTKYVNEQGSKTVLNFAITLALTLPESDALLLF